MARGRGKNLRYGVLAIVIAMVLWSIAHGGSTEEREYDVPIVLSGVPDTLVITDQSAAKINIRVQGSRAAFRNVKTTGLEYRENVTGGKPGRARYEVDDARLDLPRGVRIVGISPAQIDVMFEPRGRRNVLIRAEVEGQPPEGYTLGAVTLEPPRVWLTGPRARVMRMQEAPTETIDVSTLTETSERAVRLNLGTDNVRVENDTPLKARIEIVPPAESPVEDAKKEQAG